jgi:hypothetical protein
VVELDTMLLVIEVLWVDVLDAIVLESAEEVVLTKVATLLEALEVVATLLVVAEEVAELVDETVVTAAAVAE